MTLQENSYLRFITICPILRTTKKMKLLIAEDDPVCRSVLKRMLTELGQADIAENGREAVEYFKKSVSGKALYDLVFLDIMMPEMDGKEALQLIRKAEDEAGIEGLQRSKIVMTTALDDSGSIMTSFKSECDGYIVKPIRWKQLEKTFREIGISPPESWEGFVI